MEKLYHIVLLQHQIGSAYQILHLFQKYSAYFVFYARPSLKKKYQHPRYKINIIRFIMKYIFIFYLLIDLDVGSLFYKLDQTYLNFEKHNMHYIMKRKKN